MDILFLFALRVLYQCKMLVFNCPASHFLSHTLVRFLLSISQHNFELPAISGDVVVSRVPFFRRVNLQTIPVEHTQA